MDRAVDSSIEQVELELGLGFECEMNEVKFAGLKDGVRIRATVRNNSCSLYEVLGQIASISLTIRDEFALNTARTV